MNELGTLEQVNLREAWDHEAGSFTPWLCKHLDRLGDVIGMDLKLVKKEAPVGPFSADILAHATTDENHRVLIENQLEVSDHNHLGQITTYLGGLDARTVIWVAANFHDEHLLALKWLNEHTYEDCAFFAVKVKAVRIDDSRAAPLLEVVVHPRPNEWKPPRRVTFWEHIAAGDLATWKDVQFPYSRYAYYSSEKNEVWQVFDIEMYHLANEIGIRFKSKELDKQQAADYLNPWVEPLRKHLDVEMNHSKYTHNVFFHQHKNAHLADRSQWPDLACWLTEKLNLYRDAIDQLPATPPDG